MLIEYLPHSGTVMDEWYSGWRPAIEIPFRVVRPGGEARQGDRSRGKFFSQTGAVDSGR
jgi:hypothetical protein